MLALDAVHVHVGAAVLLDGVSLDVRPGEVTVVVGPNGAGKSTLLKVAAGERAPTRGAVTLDGTPLDRHAPEALARRRAVLPQQSALGFSFSAFEVALLGRTPHARRSTRAADEAATHGALEKAGVAAFAERRYPTLSGGEQQRVHLARALAQLDGADAPAYLLLDEPTASLDLTHQHGVLRLARALAAGGTGVLAVLHDLNLAAQYADRLVVLRRGRVLAEGPPSDVLAPALVEAAFDVPVVVLPHPCLACPLVVPVPGVPASRLPGGDGAPTFDPLPVLP